VAQLEQHLACTETFCEFDSRRIHHLSKSLIMQCDVKTETVVVSREEKFVVITLTDDEAKSLLSLVANIGGPDREGEFGIYNGCGYPLDVQFRTKVTDKLYHMLKTFVGNV
jgi:hypothetical protein